MEESSIEGHTFSVIGEYPYVRDWYLGYWGNFLTDSIIAGKLEGKRAATSLLRANGSVR